MRWDSTWRILTTTLNTVEKRPTLDEDRELAEVGGTDCRTPTTTTESALVLVADPPAGIERELRKEIPSIDVTKPPRGVSKTNSTLRRVDPIPRGLIVSLRIVKKYAKQHHQCRDENRIPQRGNLEAKHSLV